MAVNPLEILRAQAAGMLSQVEALEHGLRSLLMVLDSLEPRSSAPASAPAGGPTSASPAVATAPRVLTFDDPPAPRAPVAVPVPDVTGDLRPTL